ncbi:MAG TPA: acyl carrier protein [Dehalococcoidia bacterium]|nr:acyl carrier protein [Dehalococcoidia bacterium]
MMEPSNNKQAILEEVGSMIRQVIGEEWIQNTPITMDTTFSEDLELESIEIVALAEQVQTRFGDEVDFPGWFGTLDVDAIIGLTVGQLVDRIAERTSATGVA